MGCAWPTAPLPSVLAFFFHHSRSRTKERRRREEGKGESDEGERGKLGREYEGNYLELLAHEQGKQFLSLLNTEKPACFRACVL